ncbi:metal ABC transporter permease [Homoserinimonas sp. OAct 916]|uniref:metal ABC transporter permease n=1 Tax=Homoserinimonas sp. OAct 916 TaxID=2211450 RepID=UPI000DBE19ED|nr:metal ABC transporter permease [Homoserinimonas sp. OAct 916]
MEFLEALVEYDYLKKALVTAVVVGILCGVIGSFTILRGLALMGDAISHAVLPGIAASFLLGISFFPGALVAGLLTALGIGYVNQNSRLKNDAVIGIVFTAMFALGVVMVSLSPTSTDLTKILFGNVLAVRTSDMWITVIVGALVLLVAAALYKELQVSSFDPTMAAAYGLSTKGLHYLLMTMLTLVTVASLQTVGIILVVAMLIVPASTAYLLTDSLPRMILLAAALGVLSSAGGLYFSFSYNLPSGAAIVLVGAAGFLVAFLFAPTHGVIRRQLSARRARVLAMG